MRRRVDGNDRVMLGIFVLHLVAAMVFGGVFLQGVKEDRTFTIDGLGTTSTSEQDADAGTGTSPTPVADASSSPDPGGAGQVDNPGSAVTSQQPPAGGEAATPASEPTGSAPTASEPAGQDPGASSDPPAPASEAPGTSDAPIRIGSLVTQTGAINFRAAAQATKAYIDLVNERGGVHGQPIELLLRDDGLDPARGRRAVEEMLNQGVFAFVGFSAPLTEQSINPTLEQNEIPLVGAFGITESDWGYMFNGFYESFGWVSARFLADQGVTNPGLIYISRQDAATDRRIDESWRQAFASKDVRLDNSNIHAVDVTKSSYDDVVTQLRLNGVDGIVTSIDQTAVIRLQQSLNRSNYHPLHAASQLADDPSVLNDPDVGASLDGTYVYSEFHFLGETAGDTPTYEAEVRRRFGPEAELNWAGKNNWASTKLFVDALEAAGPNPTRADLMAALDSFVDHETGLTAPLTIGSDAVTHIRNNRCVKVGRIVQGKVEPLGPFECYDGPLL